MTKSIMKVGYDHDRTPPTALDILFNIFRDFDRFEHQVPPAVLEERLREVPLTRGDVADYVSFRDGFYQRNPLYEGIAFRALILCWRSGQRSPVHNHAGSTCYVQVIQGMATEIRFTRSRCGLLFPYTVHELEEGESAVNRDNEMHQLSNLQPPGNDLITLHVYSPPLQRMELFSLDESVFADHQQLIVLSR